MKIGTMLEDVVPSLFRRPATELYPLIRRGIPERLRGQLRWYADRCTGCGLCTKDCPANALELMVLEKKSKRFVMRYHLDRCVFCAQCVQTCRFHGLEMSDERWELAALTREPFVIYYGDEADIRSVLGQPAPTEIVPVT
jgi:formate hydrogenlyase subunit 6/NADH:ubiquinone oxidoreductase subunit I